MLFVGKTLVVEIGEILSLERGWKSVFWNFYVFASIWWHGYEEHSNDSQGGWSSRKNRLLISFLVWRKFKKVGLKTTSPWVKISFFFKVAKNWSFISKSSPPWLNYWDCTPKTPKLIEIYNFNNICKISKKFIYFCQYCIWLLKKIFKFSKLTI